MEQLVSRQEMRQWSRDCRQRGHHIGFVPTMGALHDGHLSLVQRALAENDRVVASIFVNPTQFGPHEDFQLYPREPLVDAQRLQEAGCHALFLPGVADIYPDGPLTRIVVPGLEEELCGAFRPGHFQGVATVVAILLHLVGAERAYFGKKDYQQWVLIQRMVRDLAMPVQVVGMATVRESDGLAMSSRNRRLTPEQRPRALALYQGLLAARQAFAAGERQSRVLEERLLAILQQAPVDRVDYVSLRQGDTLTFSPLADNKSVLLVAAHVGGVRLIDNMELAHGSGPP